MAKKKPLTRSQRIWKTINKLLLQAYELGWEDSYFNEGENRESSSDIIKRIKTSKFKN